MDMKLGNASNDNILYSLKNKVTKTITRVISNNSDSVPTTGTVYFDGLSNKIYCDFVMGQDADVIKFMPPFKVRVVDITVTAKETVANGGVIINKGSSAMHAELACLSVGAIARATTISPALKTVDITEYIKIVGVSSGTEGTVVFDVIQA